MHPGGEIGASDAGAGRVQRRRRRGCTVLRRGRRIGLLGGSFDPPHNGHLQISRQALRRLGLDALWWLVSPGNPLKDSPSASFATRLAAAERAVVDEPRIWASSREARFGTPYTADTLVRLARMEPDVHFVWLMGADNLANIHRWKNWLRIFLTMPVAAFARPGCQLHAGLSPAARRFAHARLPDSQAGALVRLAPPRWCLLTGPLSVDSSTAIRGAGMS